MGFYQNKSFGLFFIFSFVLVLSSPVVFSQEVKNKESAEVTLYVDYTFRLTNSDGSTSDVGLRLERVKSYLTSAKVKFLVHKLPWDRILRESSQNKNSLIFDISKTTEREPNYYWFPLDSIVDRSIYLFARNEEEFRGLSKEEVLEGDRKAICQINTAQCSILKEFGFKNEQIQEISQSASIDNQEQLLIRKRTDYIIGIKQLTAQGVIDDGENPHSIFPLFKLSDGLTYLAANKNIEEELLQKLIDQEGLDLEFPTQTVLAFSYSPYLYQNNEGEVAGTLVPKIDAFFKSRNLDYKINIVPWERAYREATIRDNTLIASLVRTPEREDLFYWIKALQTQKIYLFSQKNRPDLNNLSQEELVSGKYSAVCENESSKCEYLRKMGFPENKIISINSFTPGVQTSFVVNKRADFLIDNKEALQEDLKGLGVDEFSLAPIMELDEIQEYLAIKKGSDPFFIKRLNGDN